MYRIVDVGPCSLIAQEYKYMAFRQWLEHQLESDQEILVHILNWLERGFYYTK